MSVNVKYSANRPYSQPVAGVALAPYLSVRLRNGGVFYDTYGLVDSGASSSMFHTQHALALGLTLDPAQAQVGSGVGGNAQMWLHTIELVVAGATITASVAFSPGCPLNHGLLGRADFFERFRIGIEQRDHRLLYHRLP
jgi:hypothetical protein